MELVIGQIGVDGATYEGDEPSSMLGLDDDPEVSPEGRVSFSIFAQIAGSDLVVRGKLGCRFSAVCARCAEDFVLDVAVDPFVRYYKLGRRMDVIDLTEDIREDIILALPSIMVCSPSCKGLCSRCGKRLVDDECLCGPAEGSPCWAALDELDVDNKQ